MASQFSHLPSSEVDILLTDSGNVLEISSSSDQVTFTAIRVGTREAIDFLSNAIKEKGWVQSVSKTTAGSVQYKANVPSIYLRFFEFIAHCDLHNDGHLTAYDALKLWHSKGQMDPGELEDIMTMFDE